MKQSVAKRVALVYFFERRNRKLVEQKESENMVLQRYICNVYKE